jgi:hypothetical protein
MSKETIKSSKRKIDSLEKQVLVLKEGLANVDAISIDKLQNLDAFTISANKSLKEECTIITQLGDAHVDEIVNSSIVNGKNEYNPDIAKQRVERYFNRALYMTRTYRRSGIKITNFVLQLVGDFASGWIHDELIETNSMPPIPAMMMIEELLIKGIKTIAENANFDKIVIICNIGNHTRTTKKNHFKNTAQTSYEWWMYHNLRRYFAEQGYSNIEFILSESPYIYYSIYDKINKFSHGNHFNYQGGIGGIEVGLNKWTYRENAIMPFDMAWIGHWHTYLVGRKVRINGSVIGYNEMGRSFGFTPEPPQMQFQLLDSRRGYTYNCPIILTDF